MPASLSYLGTGNVPGLSMPSAVPGPTTSQPPDILGGLGSAPPPGVLGFPSQQPGAPEYIAESQTNGTVLLRVKNPDGTPGPVLKVIQGVSPKKGF